MRKDAIAGTFLLFMLFFICLGCRQQAAETVEAVRPILARAGELTLKNMDLLPRAGTILMALGVIVGIFGGYKRGAIAFGGGSAMLAYFSILSETPWVFTFAILVGIVALCGCVYVICRTKLALKETVVAIQEHDDIKRGMCNGDPKKQQAIRPVIDNTKQELRREGRLQ